MDTGRIGKMKTYVCTRCGKSFQGRHERCPRCGQLFVYERGGKHYDAEGNIVILSTDGRFVKRIPGPFSPKKP